MGAMMVVNSHGRRRIKIHLYNLNGVDLVARE